MAMGPLSASLLVAFGSAIGGVARFVMALAIDQRLESGFPWGTLAVNVLGAFVIGLVAGLSDRDWVRLLVMVGVLGGFTTFSSFSLQSLNLLRDGAMLQAGAYILLSVAVCLLAVWLGSLSGAAVGWKPTATAPTPEISKP